MTTCPVAQPRKIGRSPKVEPKLDMNEYHAASNSESDKHKDGKSDLSSRDVSSEADHASQRGDQILCRGANIVLGSKYCLGDRILCRKPGVSDLGNSILGGKVKEVEARRCFVKSI